MKCEKCGEEIDLSTDDNYDIDHELFTCPFCQNTYKSIDYEQSDVMITEEYIRLRNLEEENAQLFKYLKVAIKEADAWYDVTNGGKIPRSQNEEFYVARLMCDS